MQASNPVEQQLMVERLGVQQPTASQLLMDLLPPCLPAMRPAARDAAVASLLRHLPSMKQEDPQVVQRLAQVRRALLLAAVMCGVRARVEG